MLAVNGNTMDEAENAREGHSVWDIVDEECADGKSSLSFEWSRISHSHATRNTWRHFLAV
jgi:hypothetical protein